MKKQTKLQTLESILGFMDTLRDMLGHIDDKALREEFECSYENLSSMIDVIRGQRLKQSKIRLIGRRLKGVAKYHPPR